MIWTRLPMPASPKPQLQRKWVFPSGPWNVIVLLLLSLLNKSNPYNSVSSFNILSLILLPLKNQLNLHVSRYQKKPASCSSWARSTTRRNWFGTCVRLCTWRSPSASCLIYSNGSEPISHLLLKWPTRLSNRLAQPSTKITGTPFTALFSSYRWSFAAQHPTTVYRHNYRTNSDFVMLKLGHQLTHTGLPQAFTYPYYPFYITAKFNPEISYNEHWSTKIQWFSKNITKYII